MADWGLVVYSTEHAEQSYGLGLLEASKKVLALSICNNTCTGTVMQLRWPSGIERLSLEL